MKQPVNYVNGLIADVWRDWELGKGKEGIGKEAKREKGRQFNSVLITAAVSF